MDSDVQLISDGDGLAVIGVPAAVEHFLISEGLASKAVALPALDTVLSAGAATAQAASGIAANSGRWVKLTKESAKLVKKHGLRENAKTGVSTGVVKGAKGQIKSFVEFSRTPGAVLTNPALLAGAAGVMAQAALQQSLSEITDNLKTIDQKVDDVLRAQKDAVLADMIGVDLTIGEALTMREQVGRVSEVTWSKVQNTSLTITRTQAYALRQLDALAERLENKTRVADLADAAGKAEIKVQEWLAVLARCFQLHDALAVLELDRVLDASPDELDRHRLGIRTARQNRLDLISRTTGNLMTRIDAAANTANTANLKVLRHPTKSRRVVESSNHVGTVVGQFRGRLGIEDGRQSLQARRWMDVAADTRNKAIRNGMDGVDAAWRVSTDIVERARTSTGRISSRAAKQAKRLRQRDDPNAEPSTPHYDAPQATPLP